MVVILIVVKKWLRSMGWIWNAFSTTTEMIIAIIGAISIVVATTYIHVYVMTCPNQELYISHFYSKIVRIKAQITDVFFKLWFIVLSKEHDDCDNYKPRKIHIPRDKRDGVIALSYLELSLWWDKRRFSHKTITNAPK